MFIFYILYVILLLLERKKNMIQEDFSVRLKKAMELRKIKASELSKRTNISPPMISDYLKGKYKAKQNNIYQLAKALNVDINELYKVKW